MYHANTVENCCIFAQEHYIQLLTQKPLNIHPYLPDMALCYYFNIVTEDRQRIFPIM